MQNNASKVPGVRPHINESHTLNHFRKLFTVRKSRYRSRQIFVGVLAPGNRSAHIRQYVAEIESKKARHRSAARLGEFQDSKLAIVFQNTSELPQAAFVVRQIAKPERRGHQVETSIRERQVQRI